MEGQLQSCPKALLTQLATDETRAAMEGQLQSCPKRCGRGQQHDADSAAMEGQLQSCPKVYIKFKDPVYSDGPQWRGSFKAARRWGLWSTPKRPATRRNGGAASKLPEAHRRPGRQERRLRRNGGAASKLPEAYLLEDEIEGAAVPQWRGSFKAARRVPEGRVLAVVGLPQWRGSFKAARRPNAKPVPRWVLCAAMEGQLQSCPKLHLSEGCGQ